MRDAATAVIGINPNKSEPANGKTYHSHWNLYRQTADMIETCCHFDSVRRSGTLTFHFERQPDHFYHSYRQKYTKGSVPGIVIRAVLHLPEGQSGRDVGPWRDVMSCQIYQSLLPLACILLFPVSGSRTPFALGRAGRERPFQ